MPIVLSFAIRFIGLQLCRVIFVVTIHLQTIVLRFAFFVISFTNYMVYTFVK